MTITLSDLCRGLSKIVHTVEYYSDTGVELYYDPYGGIDLSSGRMRRLFHGVRLIQPWYFRLSLDASPFSIDCVLHDKDIKLYGILYQICDEFLLKAAEIGWLSKPRLDLECTLSGLR